MTNFKLGLVLETLGLPPRAAIERAAELGARCIQFDAAGDLRPEAMSATGKREFRTLLRGQNQELAAVQLPLRRGLDCAEHQQQRIDHVQKAMTYAAELGARIVTAPLPKLTAEPSLTLIESVRAIAAFGDRHGVRLALEAGFNPAETVRDWLTQFGGVVSITFDPANFLANGHDPVQSATVLAGSIIHMQARDARRGVGGAKEVAVGAGDIDWLCLMPTLGALDYRGGIVVDREEGTNRATDAVLGIRFLSRFSFHSQD